MNTDIMSISYTETDAGIPAVCFCSDIAIPIVNKTAVLSLTNFISNDLKFKINKLKVNPNLMFTLAEDDQILVEARVGTKFVKMGYVSEHELYVVMLLVLDTLKRLQDNA